MRGARPSSSSDLLGVCDRQHSPRHRGIRAGEVFVDKMKRLYWNEYGWGEFAGFNAIVIVLNLCAVIVFESAGGTCIIFPLGFAVGRF